uniref:Uncharacterized protein n=1 Tax=Triticum urartu TaxID=4572 RepID=A0A8R7PV38_TRIUA
MRRLSRGRTPGLSLTSPLLPLSHILPLISLLSRSAAAAAVASPWARWRDGSQARIPSSASILHLSGRPVATSVAAAGDLQQLLPTFHGRGRRRRRPARPRPRLPHAQEEG